MSTASVSLGEVANFIRGITFKPADVINGDHSDPIAVFRTKNVQADIDLSDVWRVPRHFVRRQEQIVQSGDMLVSTANSWNLVGKCCWVPELDFEATLGGFISLLRPERKFVCPRYLYRWFTDERTQAEVRSCARQTTNISNLSIEQCLQIKIPLPPIDEQRRIAAILDQADALRRARRRALTRLNDLAQAIFYEMFGDPKAPHVRDRIVSLGDVANFYAGNSLPEGFAYVGQNDGALLLKVAELAMPGNEEFVNSARNWAPLPDGKRKSTVAPKEAITFPKRGGAISTNRKRRLGRPAFLDPNLMAVAPRDQDILHPTYLYFWFE